MLIQSGNKRITGCYYLAVTVPLIVKITFGLIAFEFTVIVLLIMPILFVSYFTLIEPDLPGAIGSFGH